jgi:hypothetical protein
MSPKEDQTLHALNKKIPRISQIGGPKLLTNFVIFICLRNRSRRFVEAVEVKFRTLRFRRHGLLALVLSPMPLPSLHMD